jgi:hypothetical protein
MEKQSIAVQTFRIENKKIVLDNLPTDLYDKIGKEAPDYYERVDEKAWVMEATSPEDQIKYYIVVSRSKEAIQEFMNTVLFTEEILNA